MLIYVQMHKKCLKTTTKMSLLYLEILQSLTFSNTRRITSGFSMLYRAAFKTFKPIALVLDQPITLLN